MSARSAVTLSSENGPSRFQPSQEPRPTACGVQRPACLPQRPGLATVVPWPGVGRL
jgi:hypothetical protein